MRKYRVVQPYLMSSIGCLSCFRYREAISDFDKAVEKLRSATFIDYTQLGMGYKLMLSEVTMTLYY